jgi:DNA helicase-2/ATP-dependent DNA helicase PcrA
MDNDEDRDRDKVTIMTIHAAKGLEFDTVYLPGWEEGIFPSQRALDEGGLASLEEERRLAYVAITRARRRATILHAAKGLEFDTVYLPGWEEGIFPSQRALDEGGLASLEEERRLAYVAITRAKRRSTVIHAANRRIYGQWTSSLPSRFVAELPEPHIEQETTMSGGESLWRAQWSERADPFAHVAHASTRGPGWQRGMRQLNPSPQGGEGRMRGLNDSYSRPPLEVKASAVSLGNKGRDDLAVGQRVFHEKFGQGTIAAIEGNKLEIDFEHAGRKKVLDSFVSAG